MTVPTIQPEKKAWTILTGKTAIQGGPNDVWKAMLPEPPENRTAAKRLIEISTTNPQTEPASLLEQAFQRIYQRIVCPDKGQRKFISKETVPKFQAVTAIRRDDGQWTLGSAPVF